jgi:two-component system, sensor histidine kinase and response regulator
MAADSPARRGFEPGLAGPDAEIDARAAEIVREDHGRIVVQVDRLFAALLVGQWLVGIAVAVWVSPWSWAGSHHSIHLHVWAAILFGGIIAIPPVVFVLANPGRTANRYAIAVAQMLSSALLIHLTGGRIATHFHILGSLAFLACYLDWRVFVPATAVVLLDHALRGYWWPESVYGVASVSWGRTLEHVGWTVFCEIFLVSFAVRGLNEIRRNATRRAELESAEDFVVRQARAHTAELKASEERFRSLSACSPLIVFQADSHGRIVYVNERWGQITGLGDDQILGQAWVALVHDEDRDAVVAAWSEALTEGIEASHSFRLNTARGYRWLQAYSAPVHDADGSIGFHVGTLEDVHDRKTVEAELRRAKEEADAANTLKSEFLATISHELRTPMNGIFGMTELALDTDDSDERREFLHRARACAQSLMTILNDVLDFSRIEAGKCELESTTFDMRAVVDGVLDTVAVEAERKQLTLIGVVDASVPRALRGDPGRLRQIFMNLAGNALKFTDSGEIEIRVAATATSDGGDGAEPTAVLHCTVRDTGVGIPLDRQSVIFESFTQADPSDPRCHGGTGLGLAIVRQLVTLMNGEVGLTSAPGAGSTFWFTVRVPIVDAAIEEHDLSGARALLVESNPSVAAALETTLAAHGCTCVHAGSASEVGDVLAAGAERGEPLDLVVVDTTRPDLDGIQMVLRYGATPTDAPILALTPLRRGDPTSDIAVDLAAAASLSKPIKQRELVATAAALVIARRARAGALAAPDGDATSRRDLTPAA